MNLMHLGIFRQFHEHKRTAIFYFLLRSIVVAVLIFSLFKGSYESVFICILTLIVFILPAFVEINYHLDVPDTLEILIMASVFASAILGELGSFYLLVPFWDTALHAINGFVMAAVGFSLIDLFNRNEKFSFKVSPMFVVFTGFCFSMTLGVLWEFVEFLMDQFTGTDMQKDMIIHTINSVALDSKGMQVVHVSDISQTSVNGTVLPINGYLDIGLIDTMKDLFVNFIGAIVFSFYGYYYLIHRGKQNQWVDKLLPTWMDEKQIAQIEKLKKEATTGYSGNKRSVNKRKKNR